MPPSALEVMLSKAVKTFRASESRAELVRAMPSAAENVRRKNLAGVVFVSPAQLQLHSLQTVTASSTLCPAGSR